MPDRELLLNTIKKTYGTSARLIKAQEIHLSLADPLRQVIVYEFSLSQPSLACYAWQIPDPQTGTPRIHTVLAIPPIASPLDAVRSVIPLSP